MYNKCSGCWNDTLPVTSGVLLVSLLWASHAVSVEPAQELTEEAAAQLLMDHGWPLAWEHTPTGLHVVAAGLMGGPVRPRMIAALTSLPHLRSVVFHQATFEEDSLGQLGCLTGLRELYIISGRLGHARADSIPVQGAPAPVWNEVSLQPLGRLRNLHSMVLFLAVSLEGTNDLEFFHALTELRRLKLSLPAHPTDGDLRILSRLPKLEHLHFATWGNVTKAGYETLSKSPDLRAVTVATSGHLAGLGSLEQLNELETSDLKWDGAVIGELGEMSALRRLAAYRVTLDSESAACLGCLPNLQRLRIVAGKADSRANVCEPPVGFAALEDLDLCVRRDDGGAVLNYINSPSLRRLRLSHAEGIDAIERYRTLRSLWIDSSSLSRRDLLAITSLPELQSLHLELTYIPESAFDEVPVMRSLKSLHVGLSEPDDLLGHWVNLASGLVEIEARNGDVSGATLQVLSQLPNLRVLRLKGMSRFPDGGLEAIHRIASLEELELSSSVSSDHPGALTDVAILDFSRLPRLRTLNLAGNGRVSDAFVQQLKHCRLLEHLTLSRTGITDEGLRTLAGLPMLKTLDVAHTPSVTDAGVRLLSTFPSLEELDLTGTCITDAGLAHLNHIPRLRVVRLQRVEGISVQGIMGLRIARVFSGNASWEALGAGEAWKTFVESSEDAWE